MGMYTELNIAVEVNTDENTRVILEYMVADKHYELNAKLPKHRLFESPRWQYMLKGQSYYFDHTADSTFVDKDSWSEKPHNNRILNVRCDIKNYDDEIEHFLDWIYSFTATRGFIGYKRYEEHANPTLIYFTDSGVEYRKVE